MQNCDPEWDNQIFRFKTEKEDAIVYIDVFDYNRFGFSSHSFKSVNLNPNLPLSPPLTGLSHTSFLGG